MFKLRRFFLFGLALCLAGGILGCSSEPDPSGGEAVTDPTHFYEEVREDFLIDADVLGFPEDGTPKIYEGSIKAFAKDQIRDFLIAIGDPAVTLEDFYTDFSKGFNGTTSTGGTFSHSTSSRINTTWDFSYENPESEWYDEYPIYLGQADYESQAQGRLAHMFMKPQDFSFASAEEAEQDIRNCLSILGLDNLLLNRILYLDHKTMKEAGDLLQGDEQWLDMKTGKYPALKEEWTESDDGYMFEFFYGVNGSPMLHNFLSTDTFHYKGGSVIVWYKASGIVSFSISNPWDCGEVVDDPDHIVSASEALSIARVKLENTLTNSNTVIDKVSLEYMYVPDNDRYLLQPVWVVYAEYTPSLLPDVVNREYIIIDAITGEEI